MRKTPSQVARSLRALKNAQRLGLLRGVRVLPGRDACEAALAQFGVEYSGNTVPHLPLAQCTRDHCECKYVPIGSDQLRRLDATGKSPSKSQH
jgi:hypothetical protein